jgi:hypothetical protein
MDMVAPYNQPTVQRAPVQRTSGGGSLVDVLNVILDKGIVIDAWARVSVVGLEILTIEARIVIASVDTYLRYAEAIGLTALAAAPPTQAATANQQNGRALLSRPPSEDQVAGYLSEHPEGLRLGEMEAYFNAPREELGDIVNRLVDENRARRDEEHRLYFPTDNGE